MATYNGAPYLREQIESILTQLEAGDELVVVDDASTDDTLATLEKLSDARVRIFRNERNLGHVATFSRVIGLARHDVIVTSDQDDRWIAGRLTQLLQSLSTSGALLVSSNMTFIDATGRAMDFPSHELRARDSRRRWLNVARIFSGRTGYYGCAMAFRSALRRSILPIPAYVESHDLWIALAANLLRRNEHLEAATIERRVHSSNASIVRRKLSARLYSRWIHVRSILELLRRDRAARGDVRPMMNS